MHPVPVNSKNGNKTDPIRNAVNVTFNRQPGSRRQHALLEIMSCTSFGYHKEQRSAQ